jgi:hypothetical protein
MSFNIKILFLLCGAFMGMRESPLSMREGIWRGVFRVNGAAVPFNFELKGKVFSLINGSRRDEFYINRIGEDSLVVKLDSYDASLVAKIESDGKISGEYRCLGPALPFRAEAGKNYRFIEPGKAVTTKHNLSGKWEFQLTEKDMRIGLLKQHGNQLTGVMMCLMGDSRELEGTIQGNEFELSGFTGPCPLYIKGKINDDQSLSGEINNQVKFKGIKNEDAEFPDPAI